MKKILSASQIRLADKDYIEQVGHSSLELMENAARAFCSCFTQLIPDKDTEVLVLCGTGNNGGDGLAIARLLFQAGYTHIAVLVFKFSRHVSPDFEINLRALQTLPITISTLDQQEELPDISQDVLIDAILGSGLNRSVEMPLKAHFEAINRLGKRVIAVDMPSGLNEGGADILQGSVLIAEEVICFERPKLIFFLPESAPYLKQFHVVPIGLNNAFMDQLDSAISYVEETDVKSIYRTRPKFSHKGTFGHALILAGGVGKVGAGLLCAEACVYSGAGLTSLDIGEETTSVHVRLPEVMTVNLTLDQKPIKGYTCIALGPGLGDRIAPLMQLLPLKGYPLVLDADALTYLSQHREILNDLNAETILTPHMKEFDRLFGSSKSWLDRLEKAKKAAKQFHVIIILKNRYTFIVLSDGSVCINTTGNAGMSIGGMGDVLTGVIAAFLAQGYSGAEAAVLGVYLHGKAGDILQHQGMAVIPPTRLIQTLPQVIGALMK